MVQLLVILAVLPCFLAKSTIPANKLFVNTIKRWNIDVTDASDMSERWKRFSAAKESVDRSTRGVVLESLNLFSVLNDKEYEDKVAPLKRRSANATLEDVMAEFKDSLNVKKRGAQKKRSIPTSFNYWEDDVGLNAPTDQGSCGSCWSFPTVTAIEALYHDQTGELPSFSKQFYVDCTFDGDGCGGGKINDGFKKTMEDQYLVATADYAYSGKYSESCPFTDKIASFEGNAFTKLWLADIIPISTNEDAFLERLQDSPVAFGSYISDDLIDYSGGDLEDVNCESDANAHSMLLVGYTETTLRVRNSWGPEWGEGGYANYVRGSIWLGGCNFWNSGFAISTTYRREMEYEFCSNKKLVKYQDCKASCEEMNTDSESGWTLAVIPSEYHNNKLTDLVDSNWAGVKSDNKFNYLWTGISDTAKNTNYIWDDAFTPVNYRSTIENVGKYGMLNKNTGKWAFKNSLTYKARGLCSRAATCWDIGTVLENGVISFSNDILTEGTDAEASCDLGYSLIGDSSFSCVAGEWQTDLDQLTCLKTC